MSSPARKLATWEDVARLPEGVRAEVLNGEVVYTDLPKPRHQRVISGLLHFVGAPFDFGSGGGPGGWWILPEVGLELSAHDVVIPDVAGWRRERVALFPEQRPIRIGPDWICEVLSPSNAKNDLVRKADLYHRSEVPFYWIIDPAARVVEALERTGAGWTRLGAWTDGDVARIRPFDAIELEVVRLFPPETAAELASRLLETTPRSDAVRS